MTGRQFSKKRGCQSRSVSPNRKRIRIENRAAEDNTPSSQPRSPESQTIATFRFSVPSPNLEFDLGVADVPYPNIQLSEMLQMWELPAMALRACSNSGGNEASPAPAPAKMDGLKEDDMKAECARNNASLSVCAVRTDEPNEVSKAWNLGESSCSTITAPLIPGQNGATGASGASHEANSSSSLSDGEVQPLPATSAEELAMDGGMSPPCPDTATTSAEEGSQSSHHESPPKDVGAEEWARGQETETASVEVNEPENPTRNGAVDVVKVVDLCEEDREVEVRSHGTVENLIVTVEVIDLCSESEEEESDEEQYCTF